MSNTRLSRISLTSLLLAGLICSLPGCQCSGKGEKGFVSIGEFAVKSLPDGVKEVTDGMGRKLVLIPRGQKAPERYEPRQVVQVPVQRVVAYSGFDVAMLKALGVVGDVLVGVTHPPEDWTVPEVVDGMSRGTIVYLGEPDGVDLEKLKAARPELVMTWDQAAIPMLDELQVPCVITSTPVAPDLDARMRFVQFLAPFFHREAEADRYVERVSRTVERIRQKAAGLKERSKVMWGDIYEKRVMVEPGNCWVGEFIRLAGADYLFDDVYGSACIEISLERFLTSGKDADTLFTYRAANVGLTSKDAMVRTNPAVARIGPIRGGKVLSPLRHYAQSADRLDEILEEVASILHPELFPARSRQFFADLPETDPSKETVKP
jgi:iron complex transport system substrate-binding protein